MSINTFLSIIIYLFIIFVVFVFLPIFFLKQCCSLNSLLISIIIQSFIGFVLNALFLLWPTYFNIKRQNLVLEIIYLQIIYLLSIIPSIILLCKSIKKRKNNIPLTRMKCIITCYSLPLSIFFSLVTVFFFIAFFWIVTNKASVADCCQHCNSRKNVQYFFCNLIFCYMEFILYTSLRYLDLNKICCEHYRICNQKNKQKNDISLSQINLVINDANHVPNKRNESNINKTLCNIEHLPNSKEIISSIEDNKKFDMNLIFKINDDKKIKINVPSDITVQKLIDFIFKKFNIDNQTSNIEFILKSEILNKTSKDKLSEKLNNEDKIIINDKNNAIQLNKGINHLIYEKN